MIPSLVRRFKRLRDLLRDRQCLVDGNGTARNASVQAFAVHEFKDEELLALRIVQTVDRADVRMIQRGKNLGFPPEARQPFGIVGEGGRKDLQGDVATELRVLRAIHLAHPPAAEQRQDFVGAEPGAGGQGHGWGVPEYSWS